MVLNIQCAPVFSGLTWNNGCGLQTDKIKYEWEMDQGPLLLTWFNFNSSMDK